MQKDTVDELLLAQQPEDLYPIWLISYGRADAWPTRKVLEPHMDPDVFHDRVHVAVEQSQLRDYRRANPGVKFFGIPENYRDAPRSAGRARQASVDFALEAGHGQSIFLDDDLLSIRYMFQSVIGSGKNAGEEKSGYNRAEDKVRDPLLSQHILTLFSTIARDAFAADPTVVMGSARKQAMSHGAANHRTKYIINRGMTPRQFMAWNLERIHDSGVTLDLEWFGTHGDDIGYVAQLLQAGRSMFTVPCLVYDVWSEDVNIRMSSIRNADTAPALHAQEYEGLQKYEIGDHYLKVSARSLIDGSYEWGDVDWRAYHKFKGTAPVVVPWDEDAVLGELLI